MPLRCLGRCVNETIAGCAMKLCANANSMVNRQAFLHFILSHYATERVRALSREKLLPLLRPTGC